MVFLSVPILDKDMVALSEPQVDGLLADSDYDGEEPIRTTNSFAALVGISSDEDLFACLDEPRKSFSALSSP